MRLVLAILLLSVLAGAAIDQTYIQTITSNGNSMIEKTMELSIFSDQITNDTLVRMSGVCNKQPNLGCSVDVNKKKVIVSQSFISGDYYVYSTDYGFPSITKKLTISKIPTDKFSSSLERLLLAANATNQSGGVVRPIDLRDKKTNTENAKYLRLLKANITYIVNMPSVIAEAKAGNVSGMIDKTSAQFDLVSVLEVSEPIVIKSSEPNWSYIIGLFGVIVLIGVSFSFFGSKPVKKRK